VTAISQQLFSGMIDLLSLSAHLKRAEIVHMILRRQK